MVQQHIVETQTTESCFMNPCSQLEQPPTAARGIHSRTESLHRGGVFFSFYYVWLRRPILILKTLHRAASLLSRLPYILRNINCSRHITSSPPETSLLPLPSSSSPAGFQPTCITLCVVLSFLTGSQRPLAAWGGRGTEFAPRIRALVCELIWCNDRHEPQIMETEKISRWNDSSFLLCC